MGQQRTALLYGVLESTIQGENKDLWNDRPDEITLTDDGCVGVVVAIAYDDPPMQLPLPVSQIVSRYSSEIAAASEQWDRFREHSKAFGLTIPEGELLLCEVECA
jgi:hypothetical protein